jgi:ATP-dependent DNA ligase
VGTEADRREDEGVRVVKLERVVEIEFLEWTGADHRRHTKFVRLTG